MKATSASFSIDHFTELDTSPMHLSLPWLAGFFFASRISFTFVAFQNNARLGTAFTLAVGATLLFTVVLSAFNNANVISRLRTNPLLLCLATYLSAIGASLIWTQAESAAIATAYWVGMCVDVAIVFFLFCSDSCADRVRSLMRGFIAGSLVVAAIAWLAPTLPDLRIGHEEFLHPNTLGLEFALAMFLAQYLSQKDKTYGFLALLLAVSLLRTISKTSILAAFIAEALYLLRGRMSSRAARLRIIVLVPVLALAFSSLLTHYLDLYISEGDQAATLTGRTAIWIMTLSMSLEKPWTGHGLYSFHALIPSFGTFQPRHAHNEWLQQFFEFGIVGITLTAALYVSIIRMASRSGRSVYKSLAIVLVVFALIHGLADTLNFDLSLPLWLFTTFALCLHPSSTSLPEAA